MCCVHFLIFPSFIAVTRDFHSCPKSFSSTYERYTRSLQTLAETSTKNPSENEISSSVEPNEEAASVRVNSDLKVSTRHDLAIIFTCKVCDTRSIKTVCRESYTKGVVVARCDGCNNLHLIADRLGWFGEPSSVEEFLAARGEEVKKGSVDTINLTLEDLAGKQDI